MIEGLECGQSGENKKRTSLKKKKTRIRSFRNVLINHSVVLALTGAWLTYLPLEQRGLGLQQGWHGARI
jgi:hypothetical protein